MPRLVLQVQELAARQSQIRELLREVVGKLGRFEVRLQKYRPGGQIIAASDGFNANEWPTSRLFRTTCPKLFGQYYEVWLPDQANFKYHLSKSYFQLFAVPTKNERDELFCLHTDPEEPLTTHAGRVKASLHIHVKAKEDRLSPIAKAHIPLCYANVDAVLASLDAFDAAFRQAIAILRLEVIDRYC